ncbi:Ig-like domain-containing protein [Gottfriedia acidiceleris]|uniref:Ig-like domain-containing protein n=1 Tax=Gottfriedia acidiceleris TaxID=371036 RepID=UPI002F26352E
MKSFFLKSGLITALSVSLFTGKASAESNTDWAFKCGDASKTPTPSSQQVNCLLTYAAINADIPPEVVKAIAWRESGWNQEMKSHDGGLGIMQITEKTDQPRYDQQRLETDIAYNIQAGVEILNEKYNLKSGGNYLLPRINGANRHIIENWYFPVMAYNGNVPANSPLKQEDGSVNENAYQEKIFRIIEGQSYLRLDDAPPVLARYPFKTSDFDYNRDSKAPIIFKTPFYTINKELLHDSPFFLKKGEVAYVTVDGAKLRPEPNTSVEQDKPTPKWERLAKYTPLTIYDEIQFDTKKDDNQFAWFKVERADGKIGFISSAYITKKYDLANPIVTGVANGKFYNKDVKLHFNEGIATLNGTRINNDYLVSKAGSYTLVVKDSVMNTTTIKFTIDKTKPTTPTMNTVSDQSTTITGTAEAGSTVKLYINSKFQKSTIAASNKSYKFTISKQKSGTTVSVTATDKAGNVSATKSLKVLDKTPPALPVVNKVTSKSKTVTGSAEKYASVKIYRGSTLIGQSSVNSSGKFSVSIKVQKANTYLKVYVIDKSGNKSVRTIKVVK